MEQKLLPSRTDFSFQSIEAHYRCAIESGYEVIACQEYVARKAGSLAPKTIVNRVDIDFSPRKARQISEIFVRLGIRGTFFVRLHASEYNPFSFENYRCLKSIRDAGHEIGYHSEIVDQAAIWGEEAEECLVRDLTVLRTMLATPVVGVASHGGMTGLNNLDFWKDRDPKSYGLAYEAYDRSPAFNLFQEALYVSDSEWTRWKCYDRGQLVAGDRRSLAEHAIEGKPLLYVLIHPDTYYHVHRYEEE